MNQIRTCVISREKKVKSELLRIVKTKNNQVYIDANQNILGRGVYLNEQPDIIEKAVKNKILDRKLKIAVPLEIYQELLKRVKK